MEQKLRLVLKNPILRLTFKAFLFGLLLAFTHPIIFLIGAIFLYSRPLFRTLEFTMPLFVLLAAALASSRILEGTYYFYSAVIYFSLLFLVLMGIKDLVLVRRAGWEALFRLGVAYPIFLLFFYNSQSYFLTSLLVLFVVLLLFLRSILQKRIFYWTGAFLILESVWAISLLPIGFISSATLALLIFWITITLLADYLSGKRSKKAILFGITIFIILSIVIFAFSRWSL